MIMPLLGTSLILFESEGDVNSSKYLIELCQNEMTDLSTIFLGCLRFSVSRRKQRRRLAWAMTYYLLSKYHLIYLVQYLGIDRRRPTGQQGGELPGRATLHLQQGRTEVRKPQVECRNWDFGRHSMEYYAKVQDIEGHEKKFGLWTGLTSKNPLVKNFMAEQF